MVRGIGEQYRSGVALLIYLAITLGCTVAVSADTRYQLLGSDDTEQYFVEIPKLNAAQSLTLLAGQTGALFLFPYDIVEAHLASPVKGKYTIFEALNLVLKKSGLASGLSKDGVIEIYVADKKTNVGAGNDMKSSKNILGVMIGLIAGAGIQQAGAQEHASAQLEEVVVTARQRAESLQDVPVAVTAFSEDTINKTGISGMRDYVGLTANVNLQETQNSGFAFVNIRGLSQVRNVDPTVAVVVDGVLSTSGLGFSQDLYDVVQVDVLKGPQGALYGRNATGGAINITTRQPTDEFTGKVNVGFGNGNSYKLSTAISGPIAGDSVLGSLVIATKDADGWRENVNLGIESDPYKDLSISGKLLWQVSDSLSADLRYSYSQNEGGGSGFVSNASNFINGFPGNAHLPGNGSAAILPGINTAIAALVGDPNNTSIQPQGNVQGLDDREMSATSLKLEWDTDIGTVMSVTSYESLDAVTFGEQFAYYPFLQSASDVAINGLRDDAVEIPDAMFGPLSGLNANFAQNRFHSAISQEFRITSSDDQPLRWIVGAYYVQTDLDTMISINNNPGLGEVIQWGTEPNFASINPTASWNSRYISAVAPAIGAPAAIASNPNTNASALSYNFDRNKNTAWAVFMQANYDLSDSLELSFALRYDEDKREQTIMTPQEYLPTFAFDSGLSGDTREGTFDSLQPKLTLRYKPQDDRTIYVTFAEGFRSGGFNLNGVAPGVKALADGGVPGMPAGVSDRFEQEDSQSVELGFKGTYMDGSLKVSAAAFHTILDNAFAFTFIAPFTAQTIRNIKEAEIDGLELSAAWAATDHLQLDASFGLIDSEITESDWLGTAGINVVGNQMPLNPEDSFNLGATWSAYFGAWEGYLRLDYQRQGEMMFEVENFLPRDTLNLINLRMGLSNENNGLSVALWGKNLTDEDYLAELLNPNGISFYGKPAQYGIEISKRF